LELKTIRIKFKYWFIKIYAENMLFFCVKIAVLNLVQSADAYKKFFFLQFFQNRMSRQKNDSSEIFYGKKSFNGLKAVA
jgi:hypothetical protein